MEHYIAPLTILLCPPDQFNLDRAIFSLYLQDLALLPLRWLFEKQRKKHGYQSVTMHIPNHLQNRYALGQLWAYGTE